MSLIKKIKSNNDLVALIGAAGIVVGTMTIGMAGIGLYLCTNNPVEQRVNVIGNSKPELFIERNGKRFYAEIDSVSVEEYFNK